MVTIPPISQHLERQVPLYNQIYVYDQVSYTTKFYYIMNKLCILKNNDQIYVDFQATIVIDRQMAQQHRRLWSTIVNVPIFHAGYNALYGPNVDIRYRFHIEIQSKKTTVVFSK